MLRDHDGRDDLCSDDNLLKHCVGFSGLSPVVATKNLENAEVSQQTGLTSVCSHFQHIRYRSVERDESKSVGAGGRWLGHTLDFCGPRVKNDFFLGKYTKLTSITVHE